MNKGFWDNLPRPFFCLAPMADVTDAAFRYIIAKYSKYGGQDIGEYGKFTRPPLGMVGGPDVLWTEFVSAEGLCKGGYDALVKDLQFDESERPIVAQFFSKDPELMAEAARLAEKLGFDGVDINMGCPDKSVCKQGAGAAMIQTPKLAQEIILATQKATKLPVSVKTRLGYNKNELETWLPTLLETEPVAVAIHARTKKEMSKVPAHWEEIARAVEIRDDLGSTTLIIGNGDVVDMDDAERKAKETGADGIMLGRAIFGNPWLFAGLRPAKSPEDVRPSPVEALVEGLNKRPPLAERLRVLNEHLELFDKLLLHPADGGASKSFHLMKKHFKSYLKGDGYDKVFLLQLMEANNTADARAVIDGWLTRDKK